MTKMNWPRSTLILRTVKTPHVITKTHFINLNNFDLKNEKFFITLIESYFRQNQRS